jgi:uncharacterized protein (TIGR02145 family)
MKPTRKLFFHTVLAGLTIILCSLILQPKSTKDINRRSYRVCQIGAQFWTAQNLAVSRFCNGDPIPQARTNADWEKAAKEGKPAWCYYANDTLMGRKYGKLYNYYAVADPRGLAPVGWHIPGHSELSKMVYTLGGIDVAGIKLKSTSDWNQQARGSNKSRFNATPGGTRNATGTFLNINTVGQWWTTTSDVARGPNVWTMALNSFAVQIGYYQMDKGSGLSVRCIKD